MNTKPTYCVILCVYILVWVSQVIVGHLTHSLVILTDSYINIYRILDVSAGLLHFNIQSQLAKRPPGEPLRLDQVASSPKLAKLLSSTCSYQLRRLPLLCTFINGLFLQALLMSVAIEGIQTCLHEGHVKVEGGEPSILMRNPLTYPLMLCCYGLVGILMEHCTQKAHDLRERELNSASWLYLNAIQAEQRAESTGRQASGAASSASQQSNNNCCELNVDSLIEKQGSKSCDADKYSPSLKFEAYGCKMLQPPSQLTCSDPSGELKSSKQSRSILSVCLAEMNPMNKRKFMIKNKASSRQDQDEKDDVADEGRKQRRFSLDLLATQQQQSEDPIRISLRSLKKIPSTTTASRNCKPENEPQIISIKPISQVHTWTTIDLNQPQNNNHHKSTSTSSCSSGQVKSNLAPQPLEKNSWPMIRAWTSPVAMVLCAAIIYIVNHELVTEISDASLAVLVVIIHYVLSWPIMKKAGFVLLQSVPEPIDVEELRQDIKSTSHLIKDVIELHVWSLTPRSNRVLTCKICINFKDVVSKEQIELLLFQVTSKFQKQNILCSTIEPIILTDDNNNNNEDNHTHSHSHDQKLRHEDNVHQHDDSTCKIELNDTR